jgi:hypothetical protein
MTLPHGLTVLTHEDFLSKDDDIDCDINGGGSGGLSGGLTTGGLGPATESPPNYDDIDGLSVASFTYTAQPHPWQPSLPSSSASTANATSHDGVPHLLGGATVAGTGPRTVRSSSMPVLPVARIAAMSTAHMRSDRFASVGSAGHADGSVYSSVGSAAGPAVGSVSVAAVSSFGEIEMDGVGGTSVWADTFGDDDDDNDDHVNNADSGGGPSGVSGKRKRQSPQKRAQKTTQAKAQRAKEQLQREQRLAYCVQVCLDKGWG